MIHDNRQHKRRSLEFPIRIRNENSPDELPAVFIDVSEEGARLAIKDASQVEDVFTLLLSTNGQPSRHCRVIWRRGNEIGVRFD